MPNPRMRWGNCWQRQGDTWVAEVNDGTGKTQTNVFFDEEEWETFDQDMTDAGNLVHVWKL